jgi:methionyl-tRNA formyltransferase
MNRTLLQLAEQHGIPVIEIGRLASAHTLAALAAFQPDVICVASFPWRLPRTLLALPRLGCLNLHPSLLPAYRGPMPNFWVLRHGEQYSGVTLHLMDEQLDTGDILLQARLEIPEGISITELERRSAALGAPLMVQAVHLLASGTARGRKQQPEQGSYYSRPTAEDFQISTTRPARWAFNFIRGVSFMNSPLELQIGDQRFRVGQALDYQADGVLGQPYRREGNGLWAQCTPGVLHVTLKAWPQRSNRSP